MIFEDFLKIETHEILRVFFASSEKSHLSAHVRWRLLSNYLWIMRNVLLHCPIGAEIRTVDSQSDLRILL